MIEEPWRRSNIDPILIVKLKLSCNIYTKSLVKPQLPVVLTVKSQNYLFLLQNLESMDRKRCHYHLQWFADLGGHWVHFVRFWDILESVSLKKKKSQFWQQLVSCSIILNVLEKHNKYRLLKVRYIASKLSIRKPGEKTFSPFFNCIFVISCLPMKYEEKKHHYIFQRNNTI